MKKLIDKSSRILSLILTVLLASLPMVGCSDDDDDNEEKNSAPSIPDELVGHWEGLLFLADFNIEFKSDDTFVVYDLDDYDVILAKGSLDVTGNIITITDVWYADIAFTLIYKGQKISYDILSGSFSSVWLTLKPQNSREEWAFSYDTW